MAWWENCNGNQQLYHSGHYICQGLNFQATSDAYICFIVFSICAPGKTGDDIAIILTDIQTFLDSLKPGSYVVGDTAYALLDNNLVPITGSHRDDAFKYAFNYYVLQLCILKDVVWDVAEQMENYIEFTLLLTA